jgi:NAD+ synthase
MIKDIPGLIEHVTLNLQKRMDIAVLGLSGGADSTLVAILCKLALGSGNVYGMHMPYSISDKETVVPKSTKLSMHLGLPGNTVNLMCAVDYLGLEFGKLSQLNHGNMKSRMRMIALYTQTCIVGENTGKRVRVVGTGNLSEDFIGYDTKGGDALADYFPIGALLKSEVYQLLEHFRDQGIITEEMIDRVPSAGLWDGQTDEGELGYTYNEMEPWVLKGYFGDWEGHQFDPIGKFVMERHFANQHKHQASPVVGLRGFCK